MTCANCRAESQELRRRTTSNGAIQYVHQCLTCGRATSNAMSRSAIKNFRSIPDWDDTLQARYERLYSSQVQAERDAERAQWFREHNRYLRSEAWNQRRLAVLKRARGVCEGCGNVAATQVHHLTYEHWKEEFLWELVAICDECHERVHPHMEPSR